MNTAIRNLPTNEICEAFKQGFKVAEIAEMHETTPMSIRNHIKKGSPQLWELHLKTIYTEKKEKPMANKIDRSLGRKILNFFKEHSDETFTREQLAKIFNKNVEQIGRSVGILVKKDTGIERVGNGIYTCDPPTELPTTAPTSKPARHHLIWPDPVKEKKEASTVMSIEGGAELFFVSGEIKKIFELAEECGGMDKLIAKAKLLE
jgi:predicted DNA-binding protein YlxM (UPF0122 family)